jgi:VanZ family protein
MPNKPLNIRKAVMLWFSTAGYMGLIFVLSSQQKFGFSFPANSDKIIHALAYMPLGFLFYMSLRASGAKNYLLVAASLLACMYGISDEIHQFFVPGRHASLGDVFADAVGALTGSLTGSFLKN